MWKARVLQDLVDLRLHLLLRHTFEPPVEPDVLLHGQPAAGTKTHGSSTGIIPAVGIDTRLQELLEKLRCSSFCSLIKLIIYSHH